MWWKAPKPMMKWERIWRLTMLGESESRIVWQHRGVYEKCVCDCWTVKYILRGHLRQWKTKSCWCLARETSRNTMIKMTTKHSMFWTRIYWIYWWLKARCTNPKASQYCYYWARWIKCLWDTFEDFYKDMGESYEAHVKEYGEDNTTIDRIDSNWDYCKENCRRATRKEQCNNRTNNKIRTYKWKQYTQQQLSEMAWLPKHLVWRRLRSWWSVEKTVETPIIYTWLRVYFNK